MFTMKKLEGRREMFFFLELDELVKSHGMLCICQVLEEILRVFDRKYTSFL